MTKRFAGGLGPVCLAGFVYALFTTAPAPAAAPLAASSVPSDCDGSIAEITLHYDPNMAEEMESVYRDLFRNLPADMKIKVLAPSAEDVADFQAQWGSAASRGRRDVSIINVGRPITVWARDRYIARQPRTLRGRSSGFVPGPMPDYEDLQLNELQVPDLLGKLRLLPSSMQIGLLLEGGNVVANGRHVFVGVNVVYENGGLAAEEHVLSDLDAVLGRPYLLVADRYDDVPWCHVDMYMTPVDDHTLLVASPFVGTDFLELPCGDEPGDFDDLDANYLCPSDMLQAQFDEVAELAILEGYDVIRVPTIVDASEGWMITYNNVLMDERDGCLTVYMPTYDVPRLDTAAAEIYRRLGYTVHTIDVSKLYPYGGALRCVVNVTERNQVDPLKKRYATRRTRGRLRVIDLQRQPPRVSPTQRSDRTTVPPSRRAA